MCSPLGSMNDEQNVQLKIRARQGIRVLLGGMVRTEAICADKAEPSPAVC